MKHESLQIRIPLRFRERYLSSSSPDSFIQLTRPANLGRPETIKCSRHVQRESPTLSPLSPNQNAMLGVVLGFSFRAPDVSSYS